MKVTCASLILTPALTCCPGVNNAEGRMEATSNSRLDWLNRGMIGRRRGCLEFGAYQIYAFAGVSFFKLFVSSTARITGGSSSSGVCCGGKREKWVVTRCWRYGRASENPAPFFSRGDLLSGAQTAGSARAADAERTAIADNVYTAIGDASQFSRAEGRSHKGRFHSLEGSRGSSRVNRGSEGSHAASQGE